MSNKGFICKNCNSKNTVMFVNFRFLIPTSKIGEVKKSDFRRKDFELWGADYIPKEWICRDCGYTTFSKQLKEQKNG